MADFKEGDVVLAHHQNMIYEAKITRVQTIGAVTKYFLHYQGWSKRWDEWVTQDRVMQDNEANRALQARVNEEVKSVHAKKARSAAEASAEAAAAGKKRGIDATRETEDVCEGAITLTIPFVLKRHIVDDWENVTQKRLLLQLPRPAGTPTVQTVCEAFIAHMVAGPAAGEAEKEGGRGRKKAREDKAAAPAPATAAGVATPASDAAGEAAPTTAAASSANAVAAANPAFAPLPAGELPPNAKAAKDIIDGLEQYFDRAMPIHLLYRFERAHFDAYAASHSGDTRPLHQVASPEYLLRLFVRLPELLTHTTLTKDEADALQSTLSDFIKFISKHAAAYFQPENYVKATPEYCASFDAALAAVAAKAAAAASVTA